MTPAHIAEIDRLLAERIAAGASLEELRELRHQRRQIVRALRSRKRRS